MCGYNGGIIKYFVKDMLRQDNSNKAFPSILCIIAELFEGDKGIADSFVSDILKCDAVSICKKEPCLRSFYGFEKTHFMIFSSVQGLPSKYQIIKRNYKKKTIKKYEKAISCLMAKDVRGYHEKRMKAAVIYKLFSNNTWACPCDDEEYIAAMACLFYFMPEILCLAIEEECEQKKFDVNIQRAIIKCIQLYVKVVDKGVNKRTRIDEMILFFNNLYEIREIELVLGEKLLGDTAESVDKIDYVYRFCEITNDNFQELCNRLMRLNVRKDKIVALIGAENMDYIEFCSDEDSGFPHTCG